MKKVLSKVLIALALVVTSAFALVPSEASAKTYNINGETVEFVDPDDALVDPQFHPDEDGVESLAPKVAEAIAIIVGVLSVLMIVWAGFQYATAAGDPGKIARAKNIILYAIIGIVITILASAIALFVEDKVSN